MKLLIGFAYVFISLITVGCGVKGDPKPPLTPVEIGHGQPSFYRASKKINIENSETSSEPKSINQNQTNENSEKE